MTAIFYYGTMNSGKSTALLQRNHSLKAAGFDPAIFKSFFDTRDEGVIRSRLGIEDECYLIETPLDFLGLIDDLDKSPTHFLIDEAQFLSRKLIETIVLFADLAEIDVEFYGLRTSYTGELFPGSAAVMAIADEIRELPATYSDGNKAIMHLRKVNGEYVFDGNPTIVGDVVEDYESVSRKEYFRRKNDQRSDRRHILRREKED